MGGKKKKGDGGKKKGGKGKGKGAANDEDDMSV